MWFPWFTYGFFCCSVYSANDAWMLHVKYLLNISTVDHLHHCLRHTVQMMGIETIWELHTLTVMNSWPYITTGTTSLLHLPDRCRNSVKHYHVVWDGRQFCFGLGKFPDVDTLAEHFDNQPIISGDSGTQHTQIHPLETGGYWTVPDSQKKMGGGLGMRVFATVFTQLMYTST